MKKIYPLIFALAAGLTSCEDSLDVAPKDRLSETDYFKTATDLEMFSNPFYNNMLDKSIYDEQSDQIIQKTLSVIMQAGGRRTIPSSGNGWTWTDLRRINTLLGHMDMCSDAAAVTKYSAVARFFRAFFYFEKVKQFGDVPWYDRELGSSDPELYKPRDSREFVMQKMLEDIDFAIENLPAKKDEKNAPFRLTQSIRGLGYHRIGQTKILPPDLDLSVTGYQPIKFVQNPTLNGGQIDRNDRSTCDLPVYRYAEILLIYAEAKAELGTITQNDLDISVNLIRRRAGMPSIDLSTANANPDPYLASAETGYPNVSGANKGVILEIRRERGIELVQEAFRIEDLFRWKCGKCLDQAITGMFFAGPGEYDLSGNGKVDVVLYPNGTAKPKVPADALAFELGKDIVLTDGSHGYVDWHTMVKSERNGFNENRDYLYPIPSDEIGLNGSLVQNPGWGK